MIPHYFFEGKADPENMEWHVCVTNDVGHTINLPLRLDLINHSPTGFAWGYNGSGPAQLALAILAYQYDDQKALRYYQFFKEKVIARLDKDKDWTLSTSELYDHMTKIQVEYKAMWKTNE